MNQNTNTLKALNLTPEGSLGDLLLIIDMQNVYLPGQPWACQNMSGITQKIQNLIDEKLPDNLLFTRYIASKDPVGAWADYNRMYQSINATPWLNQIIDPLLPYTANYPVYDKSTYSSYLNTDVAMLCKKADRILIAGVVAECCVLATVYSAIDAGNKIIYLTDAIAGLNRDSEQLAKTVVANFSPLHTQVMTVTDYQKTR